MKTKTMTTLIKTNSIHRSPWRLGFLLIPLALALWAMPGIVHGQVQGGDLFATVNLGGTLNNGASPIYQYTSQYIPPSGTPGLFASGLDTPRGLAFDGAGNLYVATNINTGAPTAFPVQGAIMKITPDGLMSTFATGFPVGFLQGLTTDSAGNVFVSSQQPFDPNNNPGYHDLPNTLWKITPNGTLSSFATTPVSGWGLAFDSAGNLYVAASGSVNGQILRFAPDGTEDSAPFVGPTEFPSSGPIGMAFDASGNLFVSTGGTNGDGDILKFPSDYPTNPKSTFATGLVGSPRGLAFDSAGNLFVAAPGVANVGNILQFTPGGTQTLFATQNFGTFGNRGPEWLAFTTGALTPPTTAVSIVFPETTEPLTTTVTYIAPDDVPPLPSNFEVAAESINLAFDITTSTSPTPPIIIAFTVPSSLDASTLKALHYDCDTDPPNCWVDSTITYVGCDGQGENCNWRDRTGTLHPAGQDGYPTSPAENTVYASVNSLSPFLVAKFIYGAQVQQPINADGTSVFNAKRGVVPVVFTLTSDGVATCDLPPATISVFRTAGGVVGSIDESVYLLNSDSGSNFRISSCKYVYNLGAKALGPGTYKAYISIGGSVAGSVTFALK
jgi:hypothetical protein